MPRKKKTNTKSGSDNRQRPEELSDTDWAILNHVYLYHFTIIEAVRRLFFSSASESKAEEALVNLTRNGFLRHDPAYKIGSHKYYILGPTCNTLKPMGFKIPKERYVPPSGDESSYRHLSAIWFCLFDGKRRYRLSLSELYELWKDCLPDKVRIPHQPAYCLAGDGDAPIVYCLKASQSDNTKGLVKDVLSKLEENSKKMSLQSWIESGRYGYAILVPSEERRLDVKKALKRHRNQFPSVSNAPITVHYAPTPSAFTEAFKRSAGPDSSLLEANPVPDSVSTKDKRQPNKNAQKEKPIPPIDLHFGSIDVGLE